MATTTVKQAEAAKMKGNLYFKKEKLGAAIEAYTEAITLCPEVPVYWTNRALCERKRNEWEKVESDCKKALELDGKSVKAHYMLGLALLHYQQYGRAVEELEKALDLGRETKNGNTYMVGEIWNELAKARYTKWEEQASARRHQQQDLLRFLQGLMKFENQRRLKEIVGVIVSSDDRFRSLLPPEHLPRTTGSTLKEEKPSGPPLWETDSPDAANPSSAQERAGRGAGFYPPIFEQRRDAGGNDNDEFKEEAKQSVNLEPQDTHEQTQEHHNTRPPTVDPLVNGFNKQYRKSLNIRLQKFLQSPAKEFDDSTDESSREVDLSDGEVPYSIHDVYKVFKEMVKLQQGEAGKELLRTTELYERRSAFLNEVFERVAAADIPDEIPDHLCCTITMEIFRDPVITPSGMTYERSALEDHLKLVGNFDPITREPLTINQAYPNLALRHAVEAYLADHGWAYKT